MVNDIKIKNRIVAGDDISYLYKQEKSVSNNSLKDKNPNLVGKERLKIALVLPYLVPAPIIGGLYILICEGNFLIAL